MKTLIVVHLPSHDYQKINPLIFHFQINSHLLLHFYSSGTILDENLLKASSSEILLDVLVNVILYSKCIVSAAVLIYCEFKK